MAEIIGRDVEIGYSLEGTRGTAETTADKWLKKTNATIIEKAVHATDDSTTGTLEESEGRRVTQKYVEGDIEGIAHIDSLLYELACIYGVVVSTNVSGSVYSHALSLAQNITHPTMTLFVHEGAVSVQKIAACVVSKLELSVAVDDYVRRTASFIGGECTASADTPSYDTEYDFIAKDVVVKVADSENGLTGATALPLKELSLTWDTGAIRDHVIGSYLPDDIFNGKMAIEGSFTKNFTDEAFKDMFLGDTAKYMNVTITGGLIATGQYATFTLVLNKVMVTDWSTSGGSDELRTESVTFKAYRNQTDGEQSTVTIKNLMSSVDDAPSA